MSYKFSLADDDDDLTAPLLDDPTTRALSLASQGHSSERMAEPSQAPKRESWKPSASGVDPENRQKWKLAEESSLDKAQYDPSKYGIGEFARDNGGLLVAGLLDAFANKGRGLPSLAAATQGVNDKNEAIRRQQAKDAGEFAIKARSQQNTDYENELRLHTLQQQDERIRLADQGESRRGEQFSRDYDPSNPAVQAVKSDIVKRSGGIYTLDDLAKFDSKGLAQIQHTLNLASDSANTGVKARDEATIAGARARSVQGVEIAGAPDLGAARGEGERRGEDITRGGKVRTAADTSAASTGARLGAEAPREQKNRSEDFQEKFAKDNDQILKSRASLAAVVRRTPDGQIPEGLDLKSQGASKLPGGSRFNTENANLNIQDLTASATAMLRSDSGAAIGVQEGAKGMLDALGDPLAAPEYKWKAIQNFQRRLDDDLRGKSVRGPDAQAVIGRYGIHNLDVGSGSAAPSGGASAPGRVRVISPKGQPGEVSAEQAQWLLSQNSGWRIAN